MAEQATRVAIVTGATSGLGTSIAQDLHSRGWKVACIGRNAQAGHSLALTLGANAHFIRADISSYQEQAEAFKAVFHLWGRIDALCANAGIVDQSSLYNLLGNRPDADASVDAIPAEPDLSATDTNYKGLIYGVMLATHFMRFNRPSRGGRIVVTGSIGGMFPHPTYPEYCGTKAAVNMFVRDVAPILKNKEGIFINCVLPGMMDTPIVPPEMTAAVKPECLTPMKTLLDAYQVFLEDTTGMAGQLMECSADKMVYYSLPEMGNGRFTERAVTVWEPLFKMMHGEDSGLPGAIQ